MNHTITEIRDGKDALGQVVHFPVNAEKIPSAANFLGLCPVLNSLSKKP